MHPASGRVSYGDDVRPQDASGTHLRGPFAIASVNHKVNGRWGARIKDPFVGL